VFKSNLLLSDAISMAHVSKLHALTVRALLIIVSFFMLSNAHAESAGKIAVVDLQLAVMQTTAAQKSLEEFKKQKTVSEDLKSFEGDTKAYQKAREKYEKNRAVMSDSKRAEAVAELRSMEEDLQHTGTKLQKAERAFQQQVIQKFAQDALRITENIVKEQSIGLLLGRDSGAVMHATADYDITNQVTERLNKL